MLKIFLRSLFVGWKKNIMQLLHQTISKLEKDLKSGSILLVFMRVNCARSSDL